MLADELHERIEENGSPKLKERDTIALLTALLHAPLAVLSVAPRAIRVLPEIPSLGKTQHEDFQCLELTIHMKTNGAPMNHTLRLRKEQTAVDTLEGIAVTDTWDAANWIGGKETRARLKPCSRLPASLYLTQRPAFRGAPAGGPWVKDNTLPVDDRFQTARGK